MEKPFVFNIQRYSIHDGDGIRTTVFFKGCPLRCAWCHNPESRAYTPELLLNYAGCVSCGACASACPSGAIGIADGKVHTDRQKCTACGSCADTCPLDCREIAGRAYTADELLYEAEKDRAFYEQSGGGVTLSGGEVMAQAMDFIEALMKKMHAAGLSVDIDTCGYAPYENFERILPYTDTFLYDVKETDSRKHLEYTGAGNGLILENLKKLSGAGARIALRLPLIEGVNADDRHINAVIGLLKSGVRVQRIHLLPYHDIGRSKYERLGSAYAEKGIFTAPSDKKLDHFIELFGNSGYSNVVIGG